MLSIPAKALKKQLNLCSKSFFQAHQNKSVRAFSSNTEGLKIKVTSEIGKAHISYHLETPVRSSKDVSYSDSDSLHRSFLPLYDLYPSTDDAFVAPSATLTGEVFINAFSSIWYNVVVRGDLNPVHMSQYVSIGEGTVINTVSSLSLIHI